MKNGIIEIQGVRLNQEAIESLEWIQRENIPARQINCAINFILKKADHFEGDAQEVLNILSGLNYAQEILEILDVKEVQNDSV